MAPSLRMTRGAKELQYVLLFYSSIHCCTLGATNPPTLFTFAINIEVSDKDEN